MTEKDHLVSDFLITLRRLGFTIMPFLVANDDAWDGSWWIDCNE